MDYAAFLDGKRLIAAASGFAIDADALSPKLFPFQRDVTRWAIRRGRAAIWEDCGLGKTWQALEWSRLVAAHTSADILILAPLAVAQQFRDEGQKIGIDVTVCREASDLRPGINVTNYDRLAKFDPRRFGGVVLDESSCLKDYTSATRNALIESFGATPYRLACTATPAPNDFMELGNHAEFLGVMTRTEMLSMFFVHDGGSTQDWRLKGHAEREFWRWVSSWAVNIRKPSDLGYDDGDFDLPPLRMHEHIIKSDHRLAHKAGFMFAMEARTLEEQRAARKATLDARVAQAAQLANECKRPFLVWCDLNAESEASTAAIDGAVEITGSEDPDSKERKMTDFRLGKFRVLVSKASICGWGVNWQHCSDVAFVGLSHSFEAWYQAIRRTWRFGQKRPVNCHMISSDLDGAVAANLRRKQQGAERLSAEMAAHVREYVRAEVSSASRDFTGYDAGNHMEIPEWLSSSAT